MSQVQRGSSSQISSRTNDLEELTEAELIQKVQELKHQTRVLRLENEILEKTITRLDPALMHGVQQAIEYATKLQNSSLTAGSFIKLQSSKYNLDSMTMTSRSRMLSSPSRLSRRADSSARLGGTVIFGAGPRVNVLERSELVSSEMEILMLNLEKCRRKAAKQHALLRAQLEEIDVRVEDVHQARDLFKEEVITKGWDKISQRIPAEIWIRFMAEWFKVADSIIGKFRLRTSTMNTQFHKLKGQIKVKAELSESLRPVDFEKLKIENKECLEVIDKKQHQICELKKITGDANLNLTIHKKSMMEQENYLNSIVKAIQRKQKFTGQLDKEREIIQLQAEHLAAKLDNVKQVRLAYEVPDIMDYVGVKAEVSDIKHIVKILENRIHIQDIALKSLKKQLRTLSRMK